MLQRGEGLARDGQIALEFHTVPGWRELLAPDVRCESVTRSNEYSDTPIVRYRRRVLPVSPPNCLILVRMAVMAYGGAPDGRCAKGDLWARIEAHCPYITGGEAGRRLCARRHPRHHCLQILLRGA